MTGCIEYPTAFHYCCSALPKGAGWISISLPLFLLPNLLCSYSILLNMLNTYNQLDAFNYRKISRDLSEIVRTKIISSLESQREVAFVSIFLPLLHPLLNIRQK